MTFRQSVQTNLTTKYFFVASGRASRSEFWWFVLFIAIVNSICGLVAQILQPMLAASFTLTVSLLLFPPNIAVTIRRFHDRNMRGWWILVPILMLFLAIASGGTTASSPISSVLCLAMCLGYLVILCLPGQPGANRFGDQPPATPIF